MLRRGVCVCCLCRCVSSLNRVSSFANANANSNGRKRVKSTVRRPSKGKGGREGKEGYNAVAQLPGLAEC
eukprot:1625389-Rhodomonas_salina.1